MDQINEMKNKVFNKNTNFFTSVNRNNNSPQVGRYQYENNKGYMNMNRVNRSSTTPNMPNNMDMFNRNGGRFREPIQYRNNFNNMNNNINNGNYFNNMDNMTDTQFTDIQATALDAIKKADGGTLNIKPEARKEIEKTYDRNEALRELTSGIDMSYDGGDCGYV